MTSHTHSRSLQRSSLFGMEELSTCGACLCRSSVYSVTPAAPSVISGLIRKTGNSAIILRTTRGFLPIYLFVEKGADENVENKRKKEVLVFREIWYDFDLIFMKRNPKNYDGTEPTSRRMEDLLPRVLFAISEKYQDRPDLILATWPSIIGEKLASMTEAVSFDEGTLLVKVKNSTLYSLLVHNEKRRLLEALKKKFPKVDIRSIHFKMG